MKGYKIPLLRTPIQEKIPLNTPLNENQKFLMEKEIKEMLEMGAIENFSNAQNQFLRNIFLVRKKDGGYRPVINLKTLNQFVPCMQFKMESLQTLKFMMKERDYMHKTNLKDVYFTVPLDKSCRHLVRFLWEMNLYKFQCLCFGFRPAPRVFTKILEVPISFLRRLNIVYILIYLDNMVLMSQSTERLLVARDTVIFLLQHLGFVINF